MFSKDAEGDFYYTITTTPSEDEEPTWEAGIAKDGTVYLLRLDD
jgi:hypothetical protein